MKRAKSSQYQTGWEAPRVVALGCLLFLIALALDFVLAMRVHGALDPELPFRKKFFLWVIARTVLSVVLVFFLWRGIGILRYLWAAIVVLGLAMLFVTQWAQFRPPTLPLFIAVGLKTLGLACVFQPVANAWFQQMRRWSPS